MTTPTPSLRRRVVVTVLGLFALLLVLVGVLVDLAVDAQLGRDLDARLADRVAAAERLAASGTAAPQLVPLLQGQDIRVRVVAPDGTGYGDPGLDTGGPDVPGPPPIDPRRPGPAPSGPGPGGGAAPPPAPPTPPDATSTVVTRTLPDGSRLTLVADTTAITEVRSLLRGVMVAAALGALAVAGLALLAGVAAALRPSTG